MTDTMPHPETTTDACRTCGSPLAPDQRYCLNCGTRRGDARVDPLRELGVAAPMPADGFVGAAGVPPAKPTLVDRAGGPAGIAAMLLAALGVGLLIGKDHDTEVRTVLQRAPVVNVQGTPGAAVPAAGATTGAAGAGTPAESIGSGGSSSSSSSSSGGSGGSSAKSKPASKALSKTEAKKAAAATKAAQNKIKNAPKTVGTGGTAPKKDNKAPGGGSDAESIG